MDDLKGWPKRLAKLDAKVEETLNRYRDNKKSARRAHEALSLTIVVGAVLAPILTTLALQNHSSAFLGVVLQGLSVAVGLAIAVSEGLRRLIRPEARWKSTAIAVQRVVIAREAFRDTVVGVEIGSPEWVSAYLAYRSTFHAMLLKETVEFFPDEPDQSVSAGSGGRSAT